MKLKKKFFMLMTLVLMSVSLASCFSSEGSLWDNLGGGGVGEIQDNADTSAISELEDKGSDIVSEIEDSQVNVDPNEETVVAEAIKISKAGDYVLSGTIEGQINVKAQGVRLFLSNTTIKNTGKKVINSDEDLVIVLVDGTTNIIENSGEEAAEANAISGSGKVTINGGGKLTVNATKSAIKADGNFYGLGGELTLNAGTGHGISADAIILTAGTINIKSAAKDGLHAETEDEVLANDPTFKDSRGYVYISESAALNIEGVYGDGIQADTFALISGGNVSITTLPTFIKATSSDGCYRLTNGVYTKVAKENSTNYSSFYQLSQSNKGIKVGTIDYEVGEVEYEILENTAYSLIVSGGVININTTDDGLHTNGGNLLISGGNTTITTSDDGVAADKNVTISGGQLSVLKSYEGIEGETINIAGGYNVVNATDDGVNASSDATTAVQRNTCYIKISGGETFINASGDGIDSNGGVLISGGVLYVYGPTSGRDAALDSETGIIVTGGTLISVGSSGMVETPSTNSTQYVIALNLSSSASGAVTIKDGTNTIASFDPVSIFKTSKNYQSVVISSPLLVNKKTYTITTGSKTTSVTTNGIITKSGQSAGPGGR